MVFYWQRNLVYMMKHDIEKSKYNEQIGINQL
jgi:hypothetical protein